MHQTNQLDQSNTTKFMNYDVSSTLNDTKIEWFIVNYSTKEYIKFNSPKTLDKYANQFNYNWSPKDRIRWIHNDDPNVFGVRFIQETFYEM